MDLAVLTGVNRGVPGNIFIRKRIRKYIENYESNEWEWDTYPDVYFIRSSATDRTRLRKFIEQIMVVGDGEKMACAFIQPDFNFAGHWAERKGYKIGTTPAEMAANKELKERIGKEIDFLNTKLGNWEQIKKFELTPEAWTIEQGVLTPTLKLKRKALKERYLDLYNQMYGR